MITMTADAFSLILGISSFVTGILFGVFGIWLSLHIYTKAKDTERDNVKVLAEIRSETGQLRDVNEKLTAKLVSSLTSIAKEKLELTSNFVAEQRRAAAVTDSGPAADPAILTSGDSGATPKPKPDLNNAISGHQIPNLADPFTLPDLRNFCIEALAVTANSYGWINNYGQHTINILYQMNPRAIDDSFYRETATALDNTAAGYKQTMQNLDELKAARPEWFSKQHNTYIENTKSRLSEFIRNYDEAKKYYSINAAQ